MAELKALLGSESKERVLIYLYMCKKGYAREIARLFDAGLTPIQKQLERLEEDGVLRSEMVGRTRLYRFNRRYLYLKELHALLESAFRYYPPDLQIALRRARNKRRGVV